MLVVSLCLLILIALGGVERLLHEYALRKIPLRIHINGSRGKSSITRLIAAGLNAGGVVTFAKTTGSAARIIFPDGREVAPKRWGPANISEQIRSIRLISAHRPQALVIECMAIRPHLQQIEARQIVRPHIQVLTNIRLDHTDVMGEDLDSIATAFRSWRVPSSEFFLTDEASPHFPDLARQPNVHVVEPPAYHLESHLLEFPYIEHAENVALALAVCEYFGVERDKALAAMKECRPDLGALRVLSTTMAGHSVRFINAFAANDPQSLLRIWRRFDLDQPAGGEQIILILNARADRGPRTRQLLSFVQDHLRADYLVLIGEFPGALPADLRAWGFGGEKFKYLIGRPGERILQELRALITRDTILFGMGNIAGVGLEILEYFERRQAKTRAEGQKNARTLSRLGTNKSNGASAL